MTITMKRVPKCTPKCSEENIFGYVPYPTQCPCCKGHGTVDLLTRDQFGGKWSYASMAYVCRECRAMVGASDTGIAQGVLGDTETRRLRVKAHKYFDKLWQKGPAKKYASRSAAYKALAATIDVEYEDCHFGNMDSYTLMVIIKKLQNNEL